MGGCGDNGWQSTGKRNATIKAEQLEGNLSLIVIHRHHTVKVTASAQR